MLIKCLNSFVYYVCLFIIIYHNSCNKISNHSILGCAFFAELRYFFDTSPSWREEPNSKHTHLTCYEENGDGIGIKNIKSRPHFYLELFGSTSWFRFSSYDQLFFHLVSWVCKHNIFNWSSNVFVLNLNQRIIVFESLRMKVIGL